MIAIWTVLALLALLALYDLTQKRHAVLRNFPIVGHLRYWLEAFGPELRQYIVTDNDEERPFSRDQRRWVYTSCKNKNNYFGFGTDNKIELAPNYLLIRHSSFPLDSPHEGEEGYDPSHALACRKVMGEARQREKAFRPASVVNISAMSYGSLSAAAVEALNRGAALAGCLHNTGEGGVSAYHRCGGELVWQIGTGYFGCRDGEGAFSLERFRETVEKAPVRAIEIKLSQGAKPGLGGVLPGAKVTAEIAQIRGIPVGRTCVSPSRHTAFSDVDSLLDFAELLAAESGLPVGIKSAVGQPDFWHELARSMEDGSRGVDFITIDGGEGGTGAAPLVFSDHVALPFRQGFSEVYRILDAHGLVGRLVLVGSGKLGLPANASLAFGMGCDMINVAREAMLAIGCIQAQRCHSGHCPTGVATQNRWLMRGLDRTSKATRAANYIVALRRELLMISRACGVEHPGDLPLAAFDIMDGAQGTHPAAAVLGYSGPGDSGRPSSGSGK